VPKQRNITAVAQLVEALRQSPNFYLVEFRGLSVAAIDELRGAVLEAGGRLQVAKNTLLGKALAEVGLDESLSACLVGPTAVLYCLKDPVEPARALREFAKDHEGVRLKAGYVEGQVLDAAAADSVAQLPSKLEIQGSVVGAINGPLRDLVGLLQACVSELVYVLDAVADKRHEQEGA